MSWSGLREATEQATRARAQAKNDWTEVPVPLPRAHESQRAADRAEAAFQDIVTPEFFDAVLDEIEAGRASHLAANRAIRDGLSVESQKAMGLAGQAYADARVRVDSLVEDKP